MRGDLQWCYDGKDFSRPVIIKGNRPRSDSGTQSLNSSPDSSTQLIESDLTVEDRRKSAHAKFVTPRPDSMPLEFYLEKPLSVEIRDLCDMPKEPLSNDNRASEETEQSTYAKGTSEQMATEKTEQYSSARGTSVKVAIGKTEQNSSAMCTSENMEKRSKDSVGALPMISRQDSPVGSRRKQHGKSHPLSKLRLSIWQASIL